MTLMLRHGSIKLVFSLLAFAGAGIAVAQPSAAPASAYEVAYEADLTTLINAVRSSADARPLEAHKVLVEVAQAHAKDMALNGYVSYEDRDGQSLLDLVRRADRLTLYSGFGMNVAVLPVSASATDIHRAIMAEPPNAKNVLRPAFDHLGIGVASDGKRVFVVQLLARIDGQLADALPTTVRTHTELRPIFESRDLAPVGWSIIANDGRIIARGPGLRVSNPTASAVSGYLTIDVAAGADTFSLKGPYVTLN